MSEKIRHPEKVNKPINPIKKKPEWIRSKIVDSKVFFQTKKVVNQNNLVTVCQEANCPNITECWSKKHATFMIMGDTCARACSFCDVKTFFGINCSMCFVTEFSQSNNIQYLMKTITNFGSKI